MFSNTLPAKSKIGACDENEKKISQKNAKKLIKAS